MPGAPPVRLASVAEILVAPFSSSETVEPAATTSSCAPADSAPLLSVLPGDRRHAKRREAETAGIYIPSDLLEELNGYAHK